MAGPDRAVLLPLYHRNLSGQLDSILVSNFSVGELETFFTIFNPSFLDMRGRNASPKGMNPARLGIQSSAKHLKKSKWNYYISIFMF